MKKSLFYGLFLIGIIHLVSFTGCDNKDKNTETRMTDKPSHVSLSRDVMPLFARSCAVCHRRNGGNPAATADSAYFERTEDILAAVGTAIQPGNPEASPLVKVLNQTRMVGDRQIVMPPPNSRVPKWNGEEVALFSRWIKQGAGDD